MKSEGAENHANKLTNESKKRWWAENILAISREFPYI